MRRLSLLPLWAVAACSPAPSGTDVDKAVANQAVAVPARTQASPAPSPVAPAAPVMPVDSRTRVTMRCIDGSRFAARFASDRRQVTIDAGGVQRVLRQEHAAIGTHYASGAHVLEGKGDNYMLTQPGMPPLPCTVNHR